MGGLRRNCEMCGYAYKTRSQFEDNMPTRMSNSELVVEMLNVCKSFCRKCSRFLLLAGFILTLVAIVAAFVALWFMATWLLIPFVCFPLELPAIPDGLLSVPLDLLVVSEFGGVMGLSTVQGLASTMPITFVLLAFGLCGGVGITAFIHWFPAMQQYVGKSLPLLAAVPPVDSFHMVVAPGEGADPAEVGEVGEEQHVGAEDPIPEENVLMGVDLDAQGEEEEEEAGGEIPIPANVSLFAELFQSFFGVQKSFGDLISSMCWLLYQGVIFSSLIIWLPFVSISWCRHWPWVEKWSMQFGCWVLSLQEESSSPDLWVLCLYTFHLVVVVSVAALLFAILYFLGHRLFRFVTAKGPVVSPSWRSSFAASFSQIQFKIQVLLAVAKLSLMFFLESIAAKVVWGCVYSSVVSKYSPFVESVDESLDLHDFLSLCLVSVTNLLQLSHLLVVDSLLIAITW